MIPFTARNIRTWSLLGQRGTFGKTLCDLAGENERLWALTADQGALSGLQRFRAMYPGRCLNFGISEQNAVETAAGLANEGFVPFLAFQAAFAASRCADQVKTCMSYMRRNVKLVGLFAGVSVGDCGPTHYALHDLALFRAFPGMTIVSPADAGETARAVEALLNTEGPAYLRLGGPPNTPVVYREDYEFRLGRAVTLRPGADICLVATGAMVHASLEAAPGIEEATGASVSVVNVHTVKPLD